MGVSTTTAIFHLCTYQQCDGQIRQFCLLVVNRICMYAVAFLVLRCEFHLRFLSQCSSLRPALGVWGSHTVKLDGDPVHPNLQSREPVFNALFFKLFYHEGTVVFYLFTA